MPESLVQNMSEIFPTHTRDMPDKSFSGRPGVIAQVGYQKLYDPDQLRSMTLNAKTDSSEIQKYQRRRN